MEKNFDLFTATPRQFILKSSSVSDIHSSVVVVEETGDCLDLVSFVQQASENEIENESQNCQVVECAKDEAPLFHQVDEMRQKFMHEDVNTYPGLSRAFRRDHVYEDVIEAYQEDLEEILKDFPFRVQYENERAIDTGGVCRDLFSAFWEKSYVKNFDGEKLLVPAVHPNTNMAVLCLLGTILSHGFMVCGFLPIRIAFPVIAAVLFGPETEFPNNVIVDSIIDYLASYESSLISQALREVENGNELTNTLQAQVLSVLSRMGCVQVPTKNNLQKVVISTARHQFLGKLLGMLYTIHFGVPKPFRSFFEKISLQQFFGLYKALNATPERVLNLIEEPLDMNPAQARVFSYLTTFVSNSSQDDLRLFVRFVTGSSVLIDENIKITSNQLSGLSRRPISHTCSCSLEIPSPMLLIQSLNKNFFKFSRVKLHGQWMQYRT